MSSVLAAVELFNLRSYNSFGDAFRALVENRYGTLEKFLETKYGSAGMTGPRGMSYLRRIVNDAITPRDGYLTEVAPLLKIDAALLITARDSYTPAKKAAVKKAVKKKAKQSIARTKAPKPIVKKAKQLAPILVPAFKKNKPTKQQTTANDTRWVEPKTDQLNLTVRADGLADLKLNFVGIPIQKVMAAMSALSKAGLLPSEEELPGV